jgi:unsaturated rhamnogalacturonyl hydrolase
MKKLMMIVFVLGFYQAWANNLIITDYNNKRHTDNITINDSLKWSEKMALTLMLRHPEAWQIDNAKAPKWDYVHGLVLTAFEELYKSTNNPIYYNYLKGYADILIDSTGNIKTYKIQDYNIDMIEAGKILFGLYNSTKDNKYLKAMQLLRKQLEEHPRTKSGGFWHKARYPWQMWLDGLYMGAPFYARYTVEFENSKNLHDVAKQFDLIQKYLYDKKTGLLYHGWDESRDMAWANKKTGCSPNFWSRSLGWYAMALVDVLDYFPANHPKQKVIVKYLNNLSNALVKFQDKTGLWYQVTDKGGKEGNYLEASGSAMFAYTFAKGVNKGYLPKKFKDHANKAFDGLINELLTKDADGGITLTNCCAVAGLGGNPFRDGSYEYYINERKKDNDPKATGPFILAAIELGR